MTTALKYRPDIDGLRAIAVVAVVLFHAGIPFFPGGYIGVDIFFVISGYLITGIIISGLAENKFSIAEFYKRRVKRIFPALLLVLAATTLAALVILPPDRLVAYGDSLTSVTIFGSNFYFWKSVDYFSTNAHLQPLLHTWSLAVEEQFYIFYPLLLVLVARWRLRLPMILLAIGALSLLLAAVMVVRAPNAAFYFLPTRAWELVLGGLVACRTPAPSTDKRITIPASIVGLALMLLPIVVYDADTPFPGLAAVPPTMGAALVIWSGSLRFGPLHRLLSTAPFLQVGKASYSFYLWHFPLFSFAAYLNGGTIGVSTGAILSIASLLISFATLALLENPVRRSTAVRAYAVPLAIMAVVLPVALGLARSSGLPDRLSPEMAHLAAVSLDKDRHPRECMSVGDAIIAPEDACRLGESRALPRTMLWGDSHAMVTATAMETAAKRAGESFLFAATADCPPGLGFSISTATHKVLTTTASYRFCSEYNQRMFERAVRDPRLENVVLSARWTNWRIGEPENRAEAPADIRLEDEHGVAPTSGANARIFEQGFVRLISALTRSGKTVYLVGPLPEPQFNVPHMLYIAEFGLVDRPKPTTIGDFERRHQRILALLKDVERDYPVRVLWPHTVLCEQASCPLIEGGEPIYFDHNHLSVYAARKTSSLYEQIFAGNPVRLSAR